MTRCRSLNVSCFVFKKYPVNQIEGFGAAFLDGDEKRSSLMELRDFLRHVLTGAISLATIQIRKRNLGKKRLGGYRAVLSRYRRGGWYREHPPAPLTVIARFSIHPRQS